MGVKRVIHIVDDEDAIRRSAGFMLKASGFTVTTWTSGVEFLKNVKHTEQGCILLDVRMPEMDGLEVQQMLADRGVAMPVVILTGHGDVSIAVRAMKAGAIDFIEKIFNSVYIFLGADFSRLYRYASVTVFPGKYSRANNLLIGKRVPVCSVVSCSNSAVKTILAANIRHFN